MALPHPEAEALKAHHSSTFTIGKSNHRENKAKVLLAIPFLLFFLSLLLGYSQEVFSPFLPIFAVFGYFLALFLKRVGFYTFSVALLLFGFFYLNKTSPFLWNIGLLSSFALACLSSSLIFDDGELFSNENENKEEALQDEIERLLEEAKIRRIEKESLEAHLYQARSESLEHIDAHKRLMEEKVQLNFKLKQEHQNSAALENSLKELQSLKRIEIEEKERLHRELQAEKERSESLQSNLLTLEKRLESLNNKITSEVYVEEQGLSENALQSELSDSQAARKIAILEGLYKQLREQFEEKKNILNETRKALFKSEGELHILEKKLELAAFETQAQIPFLKDMPLIIEEMRLLEDEISALEALISHIQAP